MFRLSRLICLLLFFSFPSISFAWWNDAWSYRMAIGIDASATGASLAETNENVAVLLKLHSGNFEDFFLIKEDMSDLRFIANDDKTPLKHHIEHFDLINQFIYIWVKLPKISAGINTERMWMYYGNADAVANEDAGGTFDAETSLVSHFKQGVPVQDSTAFGAHAANFDGTLVDQSVVAAGASFAQGNRLKIMDLPSLAITPGKGMTIAFWVKPLGSQTDAMIFERSDGNNSLSIKLNGNNISAALETNSGAVFETAATPAITPDTWQHVALTLNDTKMTLYVAGNQASFTGIALEAMAGNWSFGGAVNEGNDFVGDIDELTISSIERNESWIKTAVATQGLASTLLKVQPAEQLGSGGGDGLWSVMFKSTGPSGWTVIFLLGIMALISWFVMLGKFLYMRSVNKDNVNFLDEYNKIKHRNPALLDHEETEEDQLLEKSPVMQAVFGKHDHYQSSPIYRLYHRGIQEVQGRIGSTSARTKGLNSEAVEAITATLDAQMIRETQRLNSKMVLLTIAISGGPFLGLLGTVLGVMMTFAAIALTGDVNIAAIAPGVAAALLTTVAGLVVAIPSLFGYNYLMTQIKLAVADMRVFKDEYITRLAEYYHDIPVVNTSSQPQVKTEEYA